MKRKLMTLAILALFALGARAVNVTVKNFDDDLATVYVNDQPVADGETVVVESGDSVKLELTDFRSDYYFRYAPASQTDRTLALESWEGLPDGTSTCDNPVYITPTADLTITPNVDVKGYCWTLDASTMRIDDGHFCWGSSTKNETLRTIQLGKCVTNWWVTAETSTVRDHVLDLVQRVRYDNRNYTICGLYESYCFDYSRVGTLVVPPKCGVYVTNLTYGDSTYAYVTNVVGFYDLKTASIGDATFIRSCSGFAGPATNFVPRRAASIGNYAYQGKGLTGELLLENIAWIGEQAFMNCSSLASLRITSPNLATISAKAFSGCTKLKDVTFAGSLAKFTSVNTTSFAAAVTNYAFTVAPPSVAVLDTVLNNQTAVDGAHACRLTVDPSLADWWSLTQDPSAAELAAGLPANCMGAYATASGGRKAWIVGSSAASDILLEGDMTMSGKAGFTAHAGLKSGDTVEMTAPSGFDRCRLQHRVDGVWTTYETVEETSFTYTHGGELTRAVWAVDGVRLTTTVNNHNGSIAVTVVSGEEVSSGIYAKGSVVRLTATGAAAHPTSHFNGWTEGVPAASAASAVVEITLDADTTVAADFYPDEWIYTASTKKMTDGEWTCTATLSGSELTVTGTAAGENGAPLWLDFSLPVHPSTDPETDYVVVGLNTYNTATFRRLKFGTEFRSFGVDTFCRGSTILERLDGLGASKLTGYPYAFLYECGNSPFATTTIYEANDYIPPGLKNVGWYAQPYASPKLTGTLVLNAVTCLYKHGVYTLSFLRNNLYGTVGDTTYSVTNIQLLAKELTEISGGVFDYARIESLTIGATNLTTVASGAFVNYDKRFREVKFTADAPVLSALDTLISSWTAVDGAHDCHLTVNPGEASWWNLVIDPSEAERAAGLPADCMGVYVTEAGGRKAWIVGSSPVSGVLLEGDMLMTGNAGFVPRTGLKSGDIVQMTAPQGYDACELQHRVDGVWTTYETVRQTSFAYTHGTELTRAVWKVDGFILTTQANNYGGTISTELVSGQEVTAGVYKNGSVVRVTATGAAAHPTSHFSAWTAGVDAADAASASVLVTMTNDLTVAADFYPDEWIYTASTKKMTDGEWTCSVTLSGTELKVTGTSAADPYNQPVWLDLSLPAHPSTDLATTYFCTDIGCSPSGLRRLRVGTEFKNISAQPFYQYGGENLERIDGLGASKLTAFGYAILYGCGSSPIRSAIYEANDFIPPGLSYVGWSVSLAGAPNLTGTLELNAATCLYKVSSQNWNFLNSRLYGTVGEKTFSVTNILLTAEALTEIPSGVFGNARIEALTIGSTNLTAVTSGAFGNYNGRFRALTFLAHAPTVAALDTIVGLAATTNMTVYCSRHAPGWKALRMAGYRVAAEWAGRPAGTWGIYQTADGKKRYYMVQKDSKYDQRDGLVVIVK